jgi:type VI protein secretion system component Hcp
MDFSMKNNILRISVLVVALGLAGGAWAADLAYMILSVHGKELKGEDNKGLAVELTVVPDRKPSGGQKAHHLFMVKLHVDKTAPVFMKLNQENEVIPEVQVRLYRSEAGGPSKVFCTYRFKNAVVAGTQVSDQTQTVPILTVQFVYESLTIEENHPAGSSEKEAKPKDFGPTVW